MLDTCDVAIVGGGPVGLLLGCLLAKRGVSVRVLETRAARRVHSRAVGIHPPGLACLAEVGVADAVLAEAVRVRRAFAISGPRTLGAVSFDRLPGPYQFVLAVPQNTTEAALERRLGELAEGALSKGHEVVRAQLEPAQATLTVCADKREYTLRARFVVGCDGKRSVIRAAAGIGYSGSAYRDHFLMADVRDDTPFGSDAVVFLSRQGVVESFPLPAGVRRWVVGVGREALAADAALVEALVLGRTGQRARASTATMVSAFVPERYLADRFAHGHAVLAGDAAHVLSPIGGQGMNLGWLDATLLAHVLREALARPERTEHLLGTYSRARRRVARIAIRRAELFMTIGQTQRLTMLRDGFVAALLSAPLVERAAQLFTMRGLAPLNGRDYVSQT